MKNPPLDELQQHFKEVLKTRKKTLHSQLTPANEQDVRLNVYQYAYLARIQESLEDDFAQTRELLGAVPFAELVKEYVSAQPSRSWTIAEYSADFPKFLKERVVEKYIFDLAEFEWLKIKCSLAAGAKEFDPASIIHAGEAEWVMAKMKVVPSLMIFSSHWPVDNYKSLKDHEHKTGNVYYYALFRAFTGLEILELTHLQVDLLEEMNMGKNFGELAQSFSTKGLGVEEVGAAVRAWVQAGLIEKVVFSDSKVI